MAFTLKLLPQLGAYLANVRRRVWTPSPVDDEDRVPVNLSVPVISGGDEVDDVLTATTGSWRYSRFNGFAYQWKRDGVAIAGAESSSYTVVLADEGTDLTVTVTAHNVCGPAAATSAAHAIPVPEPPP